MNIQGTEYVVTDTTDCCEQGPMIGYKAKRGRMKFGRHLADWQHHCVEFPTRIVSTSE